MKLNARDLVDIAVIVGLNALLVYLISDLLLMGWWKAVAFLFLVGAADVVRRAREGDED